MTASDYVTPAGIPGIGQIPWGSHFCHFFKTPDDLIHSLVPYFVAGIDLNQRCIWGTGVPLSPERAKEELAKQTPELERYLREGRLAIVDHCDWYRSATPDPVATLLEEERKALAEGFSGVRGAGIVSWLRPSDVGSFERYEHQLTQALRERRIVTLCSFNVAERDSHEISRAIQAHQFTLGRHNGDWELIETVLDTHHNPR